MWAIEPRMIDWDLVTDGITPDDKALNAAYVISTARKMGALLYLLPEDIVNVRANMIMCFTAQICALDRC